MIIMQRSDGGGSFEAVDMLNGKLLCGCDDVHACVVTLFTYWFEYNMLHWFTQIHGKEFMAIWYTF